VARTAFAHRVSMAPKALRQRRTCRERVARRSLGRMPMATRGCSGEAVAMLPALSSFTMTFGSNRRRAANGRGSVVPLLRTPLVSTVQRASRRLLICRVHVRVTLRGKTPAVTCGCSAGKPQQAPPRVLPFLTTFGNISPRAASGPGSAGQAPSMQRVFTEPKAQLRARTCQVHVAEAAVGLTPRATSGCSAATGTIPRGLSAS
jgi:hypothetical protein